MQGSRFYDEAKCIYSAFSSLQSIAAIRLYES